MKQKIALKESQLKAMIAEAVRKTLNENSSSNWYGCPNIHMIWHGEWSDPELEANGYVANYYDIENAWWRQFLDETGHSDSESNDPAVEDEFAQYLQQNEDSIIDDIMSCGTSNMDESKIKRIITKSVKRALKENKTMNMIAESITETINELDYKTYINAGKKAGKGGDISAQRKLNPNGTPAQWFQDAVRNRERAKKFYDKAKEEFNQTHGYKNGRRYDDDYSAVELGGDFTASEEFGPHIRGFKSKGYGEPYKYEYGRRYNGYAGKDMSPEEFFDGNGDASNAFNNAQEEWANFKQGKYDYDNEKGWHLKESQLKNIIGKAVREALHR